MNTAKLKTFAQTARNILIEGVSTKVLYWGFDTKGNIIDEPQKIEGGFILREEIIDDPTVPFKWDALKRAIKQKGINQVVEEAAYTWFNRIMAIRILSKNGYEQSQLEYASDDLNTPIILQRARRGHYAYLNNDEQQRLKTILTDYSQETKAFGILLTGYCHSNKLIKNVFGRLDDYTELLLPDDILNENGFVQYLNSSDAISDEDYKQVELIGWLYQFYISEKKDEVFAQFKKNKKAEAADIPAATQIFTPNWIVKYMVENTVGQLWLDLNPNSSIKNEMKYRVEPAEGNPKSEAIINEIAELKLLDPAAGSGHILVEGFELLYKMYIEEFYSDEEAVISILQNNLFGLDIDLRAVQLARFAIILKAASKYPDILKKEILPQVYAMPAPADFNRQEILDFLGEEGIQYEEKLTDVLNLMQDARNLGSIMIFELDNETREFFLQRFNALKTKQIRNNLEEVLLLKIEPFIQIIKILSNKYEAVAANPPYMGSGNMNAQLKKYINSQYQHSKSDLFAVFMDVCIGLNISKGLMGMINQHSWMFLSSFEKQREEILSNYGIISMLHLGPRTFEEISGEVVQSTAFVIKKGNNFRHGTYYRLVNFRSNYEKETNFLNYNNCFPSIYQNNFKKIPGCPIAYWISEKTFNHFERLNKIEKDFESGGRIKTHNNSIFIKYFWEVSEKDIDRNKKWLFVENGGDSRKWFGNTINVVNWSQKARNIYSSHGGLSNSKYWNKRGISWSIISSRNTSFRLKESNCEYTSGSPTIFENNFEHIFSTLAFLNSKYVSSLLKIMNPTVNTTVGDVLNLPIIEDKSYINLIEENAKSSVDISKTDWNNFEISWDYKKSPLLCDTGYLEQDYISWKEKASKEFFQLHTNEEELNRIFIEIYNLQDELTPIVALKDITILQDELDRGKLDKLEPIFRQKGKDNVELPIKKDVVIQQLISYTVGCMMGRYRLDIPGLHIAHPNPTKEDVCIYEYNGSKFEIDDDAIIPLMGNNCNFSDDAVNRFNYFLEAVWGLDTLTQNKNFIEECLDKEIEKYLVKDFWGKHCRMYKKKPIYWLFASKNNAFQVLVYMHRMNRFTVEKIRSKYLLKHIQFLQSEISQLEKDTASLSRQDARRLDQLRKDLMECEEYDLYLKDMADRQIEFDLDDGVIENHKLFDGIVAKIK